MINYSIKKHKQMGCYILWKDIENKRSYASHCIYQGTRKECEEELNKIKNKGVK